MKVRMINGFSFHGIHCSALGCYYRPSAKSRGDEMEDYNISDIQTDSRDGGYYIGTRVLPREFELDCYFEEITEVQLEQIYRWLRRDTQGE